MTNFDIPYWMRVLRFLNRYDSDVYESMVAKELDVSYHRSGENTHAFQGWDESQSSGDSTSIPTIRGRESSQ